VNADDPVDGDDLLGGDDPLDGDDSLDGDDPLQGGETPEGEEGASLFLEGDGFDLLVQLTTITLTLTDDEGASEPVVITVERAFNHGGFVSALAKAAPKGPGHGKIVSLLAGSDAGKKGWLEDGDSEEPDDSTEIDPVDPETDTAAAVSKDAQQKKSKAKNSKAKAPGKAGKKGRK
jgi:hypothetical protein